MSATPNIIDVDQILRILANGALDEETKELAKSVLKDSLKVAQKMVENEGKELFEMLDAMKKMASQ